MKTYSQESEIRQSDQILRKLNNIKIQMDAKREVTSPTNLNQYLPNYSHFQNSQRAQKQQLDNSRYSYRQSLQKKLEKLFKEERKGFNESRFSVENEVPRNYGISVPTREAFTLQEMQSKISQLEKKYLHEEPIAQENRTRNKFRYESHSRSPKKHHMIEQVEQIPNRKAKSIHANNVTRNNTAMVYVEEKQDIKSDKKLLAEIELLKKEIKQIKKQNLSVNQKLEMKESQKQSKRERSKYLLKSILNKLIDIQQEVQRRDQKQQRKNGGKPTITMTAAEERKLLKESNFDLQKQIGELNKQLRIEVNQKEIAEQRSKWMEQEMRKIGKQ